MNVVLNISYVGTNYAGWQVQPNAVSVAEKLIESIRKVTGKTVKLNGSGRTDAGVHALGQVANFRIDSKIPAEKFANAINHYLPDDIVVNYSFEAGEDFHARFNAKGKCYQYKIYTGKTKNPFLKDRAWHFTYDIDIDKMREAAKIIEGTHDFKAFMASGSQVTDTVRTVYSVDIDENDGVITVTVKGNGFLY
ncbi:MAG: tRNA pseudouridine(38-40) synthase TruA, partial [Anaerofustis stercorihominis]|nr:tRNA pseudouridine(38-40) synthase TruA [Anaerofustis stercorihominis]